MKALKNITIIIGLILFINTFLLSQNTTNYIHTSSIIANPERGWYDDYYSYIGSTLGSNYLPLNTHELINNREKDKITLILRLFYLHHFFEETSVSNEYLSLMQADFDSIRAAGVKCIVRFAYSASESVSIWDATPDKVFSHIESLGDVLSNNSDIIAGVQAGFIGVWGEWYYTTNFAGSGYVPSETDQENRRAVVEKLLSVLPENISVQTRTPAIMRNIVQTNDPITETEAFDGSIKSRVGHHNDCFLANGTDYGTYENLSEDIAYLNETTKYTITGGETCDASNSYSDCSSTTPRIKELHWTYLNRDYNKKVYAKWKDQDCYGEINLSLGYRIYLVSASINDSVDSGSVLNLSFTFKNIGYAAPTQYKPIQIVLTNTETEAQTVLDYTGTNNDIRYWLPGEIQLNGQISIPDSLTDRNFKMSLQFPDQDPVLSQNPAYSIQLANVGTWNNEKGTNELNHILSVGMGGVGELPAIPINIDATTISENEINLTWSAGSGDVGGFEIMQSIKDENIWEKIAEVEANTTNYTDNDLLKGTEYHYIIRSINNYGSSSWTDIVSATTLGVSASGVLMQATNIYPNPLNNSPLTIQFPNKSNKHIIISKVLGQKVFETTTNQEKIQIDNVFFQDGIYIVSINQNGEVINKKIIVL